MNNYKILLHFDRLNASHSLFDIRYSLFILPFSLCAALSRGVSWLHSSVQRRYREAALWYPALKGRAIQDGATHISHRRFSLRHSILFFFLSFSFFLLSFLFIQCTNNPNQEPSTKSQACTERSRSEPRTKSQEPSAKNQEPSPKNQLPKTIITDTCPKPRIFTIPKTGVTPVVIQTKSGTKTIKLEPPQTVPSGFISYMKNYNTEQGLALSSISYGHKSAICDHLGNLWFAIQGGGVSRYDGNCEALTNTAKNNKSVSKSFTNFTTAQGLANNSVMAIIQDRKGIIWIGTNLGLSGLSFEEAKLQEKTDKVNSLQGEKIIPAGLLNVSNEELKKYKPVWEIYNNSTGYPVKDVNGGSANGAMLCDSKGIIWAGTGDDKTALVCFDHNAVIKSKQPPVVVLQNVKVNNENICWYNLKSSKTQGSSSKTQDLGLDSLNLELGTSSEDSLAIINEELLTFNKELTDTERIAMQQKFAGIKFDGITKFYPLPENLILPYVHNNVTFEFNAIEPGRHFLVRYQYMLEGYDNDWSPVTDKSSATFGNIYEGTYTFKVKACSPDGVWSRDAACYVFTVLPPWYRTWWMYAVYVLFLGSGFWVLGSG